MKFMIRFILSHSAIVISSKARAHGVKSYCFLFSGASRCAHKKTMGIGMFGTKKYQLERNNCV